MLVGLDEFADVLVLLQPGPCAAPTVSGFERGEVRMLHSARVFRGCRGRDQPGRDTADEEDGKGDPVWVDRHAAGSEHEAA